MKTPDEIKKGLECCAETGKCSMCPYERPCDIVAEEDERMWFGEPVMKDALAYIQQLERERDAAVERLHGWCEVCVHWENEDSIAFCDGCTHNYPFEHETNFTDRWQWRGVQEVE